MDSAQTHGLQLHLSLPLIDVRVTLAANVAEEAVHAEIEQSPLSMHVLARAHAFRALRHDDEIATWLEDVDGRNHSLHGLIVGGVERIAGRARHHSLEPSGNRYLRKVAD